MRAVLALIVLAVVIVGLVAFIVVGWPRVASALATTAPAPVQPIEFSHQIHIKVAQLDCQFCHRTATTDAPAGIPSVEQCMFCHSVVAKGRPEVEKVRSAFERREPINWVRVHRMPDHVHFVHEPHLRAGFECATCHGQVGEMPRVRQVRALNMGDCVDCHRQNNARTDCGVCHY